MTAAVQTKKRKNAKAEANDAYAEGSDAAMAGAKLSYNPYDPVEDAVDYKLWAEGWQMASEDTTVE